MNVKALTWMVLAALAGMGAVTTAQAQARESAAHAHAVRAAAACLAPAVWAVPESTRPRNDHPTAILAAMANRDVVLLGEHHDDVDHHRWQLQTLAVLHAHRPEMVIGFEMFPRRLQPVLDRWVAGELSDTEFLTQVEWEKVWNMPPELYLPLFQFARLNRIPMVALNVDSQLNKATVARGWKAIPAEEREGVGNPALPPTAYVDFLFDIHRQHVFMRGHATSKSEKADKSDADFLNFVDSQLLWDRAMAEALARPLTSQAEVDKRRPLVVGIMGSGHIRYGHGVPHQLRDLGVDKIGTLLPVSAALPCAELPYGLADAVFAVPPRPTDPIPPPRLGVRLETHPEGTRILVVTAGSLAESTGLLADDIIVEAAGAPAPKMAMVISTIRNLPPGTWMPLKVKRGDETLDVVVKFPAKS